MLYAIGVGLDAEAHITNEARRAIRACGVIYALTPDAEAIVIIRRINPAVRVVDCRQYYDHYSERPDVYDAIADAVIAECSPYTNVALVVYGHPMFLVSAVEKILLRAKNSKIDTKVIPGISSFDTVMADLQIDLGYGVTVVDASLLLSSRVAIDPGLPLLIFQVANIGSSAVEHDAIPIGRIQFLLDFLMESYPASHPCKMIVSQKSIFEDGYIIEETLSGLLANPRVSLGERPTLYVPALGRDNVLR